MTGVRRGFTLIELMIVVAIIAIIAAIAIPSLLRSRIAANEVSCQAVLKQIVSTEGVWRQTDSDRNGIQDYWTQDVAGFYAFTDAGGQRLKYVDIGVARADQTWWPTYNIGPVSSKSGYWFTSMLGDENIIPYSLNPVNGIGACNDSEYAFCGYPQSYNVTGVRQYIVNQMGVIYEKDAGGGAATIWFPASDPTVSGWTAAQ